MVKGEPWEKRGKLWGIKGKMKFPNEEELGAPELKRFKNHRSE